MHLQCNILTCTGRGLFSRKFPFKAKMHFGTTPRIWFLSEATQICPLLAPFPPHPLANKRTSNRPTYSTATNGWLLSVLFEISAVLALNWRLKASCLLFLSEILQLVSLQRRWSQRWSDTLKIYLRSCGMNSWETQFSIHIPKPTCKRLVSQCGSSYSVGLQDCCLVNANCKF